MLTVATWCDWRSAIIYGAIVATAHGSSFNAGETSVVFIKLNSILQTQVMIASKRQKTSRSTRKVTRAEIIGMAVQSRKSRLFKTVQIRKRCASRAEVIRIQTKREDISSRRFGLSMPGLYRSGRLAKCPRRHKPLLPQRPDQRSNRANWSRSKGRSLPRQ